VLDPEITLFDEPDSGLDPVRTAYLNQLIVDLNAQIGAIFLIVTHDINTARTVPDNIGLLYRRHLAMFGPREMLLSSNEPVVRQFLNARRQGPIGMAEEKDASELESEKDDVMPDLPSIPDQLEPSDGRRRSSQREKVRGCASTASRRPKDRRPATTSSGRTAAATRSAPPMGRGRHMLPARGKTAGERAQPRPPARSSPAATCSPSSSTPSGRSSGCPSRSGR